MDFSGLPILVVGDIMLDEYVWCRAVRVSPEAPVPILEFVSKTYSLGGAANVAANIASMRGLPRHVGFIGRDAAGSLLEKMLSDIGVSSDGIWRTHDYPTTVKTRIVADGKQVARIDHELKRPWDGGRMARTACERLPFDRAVVVSDYGKGVITDEFLNQFLPAARAAGVPVVVDPKGADITKYRGATVVKPNQIEAGKMLGRTLTTEDDIERAGAELVAMLGGDSSVIITRGPQGMSLFRPNAPPLHIPAISREVFDVTGAGDTVAATLALAIGSGMSLPRACELASLSAAAVVQKVGTATVSFDELLTSMGA